MSDSLCEYKDIFGKPGQGFHSTRLFNIAIYDVLGTILLAYLLYKFFGKYHFMVYLIVLLILGEILHAIFCVDTTITKLLC